MKTVFIIGCCFIFISCLNKRIEITSDYVINENWNKRGDETGGNSIAISKMKLRKDSVINPFSNLSQEEILNKLEVDSSFMFIANVKVKQNNTYKDKKIYFNKDNGFVWWTNRGEQSTSIIGSLQANTWYEISRLTYYYCVVYIDSINNVHRFDVNLANY